ncbi:helix-turn-helix transcriptional regulator [Ornithinimicrobium pratense]|nr:WYL domain-containing protein [Ornithinimicrobium pratense]
MTERNRTSTRLLTLLSLLQARRDWPGATLADRLEVTPRTVRRDIDRLRQLGYPVQAFKGPDGGYRLEAGSQLPPLLFDDEQAVAMAVGLQLAATGGAGLGEAASRALTTVRQVMPARLRHRVDSVQFTPVASHRAPEVTPSVLAALSSAVRAHEVLRFDYRKDEAAAGAPVAAGPTPVITPNRIPPPPRRVEPHHLITRNGRWYLLAWDLDRGDWRTYRADRITPRLPTGPRFAPRDVPGGELATFVNGLFKGSTDGSDAWPCTGTVELALPTSQVTPYAYDGIVEDLGPERCRLTLGAWSWIGLAAAIARYDADILVVGPPALADAFRTLAHRFTAAAATTSPRSAR